MSMSPSHVSPFLGPNSLSALALAYVGAKIPDSLSWT